MVQNLRLAIVLVVFAFSFTSAFACNCTAQTSIKASVENSAIVFTGMVLKIEYFGLAETIDPDSLALARTLPHESSKTSSTRQWYSKPPWSS